ncbi:abortive infection family protein [Commensalibacter oyaizuii]|uniref:Abortive infection family protein n=1 Tax=Commensalibacter oyaizuii TaxID=3043873 RepID=A0ABT6Q0Z5_9PROT|nr:abortive infection family protein [Commensalibacter sp. TBRC 16381]MDI2090785.1 abortive infection family protein [Commensalibacter sp. TBRC 16381]
MEIESSSIVIRVLKNLWEYRTNNSLSDETVEEKIRIENCFLQLLERIENKGDVIQADGVDTFIKDLTLEELVQSIKQYIDNNKPHVAMDRLHTYSMKKFAYLILQEDKTICEESDPLYSRVGKYIKLLKNDKNLTATSETIIKSSINVFNKLNDIRNNKSLAHDNDLLEYCEARFIFSSINLILRFIKDIEKEKFEQ